MFNILLSSAGRRVALLRILKQSLKNLGLSGEIIATDMQPAAAAFQSAHRGYLVPPCSSDEFIPTMLELCRNEGVRLVIPTIDTELAVLARHRDDFSALGATVNVSGPETIAIANGKDLTHRFLVEHGFPTPRQAAPDEVLAEEASWPLPLFAKPVGGSRSVGARLIRTRDDIRALPRHTEYIIQTLARGAEYTVDALVDRQGKCVCAVPRRRLEVRDGEVSKGMTVREPRIEAVVRRVCEALPDAFGALCVQVFFDRETGSLEVIEINARFGGGFPLAWQAGALFPEWLIEEVLERPRSASASAWQHGLVMLRFDDAIFAPASELKIDPS